jgi:hypothetical protein
MGSKVEYFIKNEITKTSYYEIKISLIFSLIALVYCILVKQVNFSNIILLMTFFALCWYSFETRQLKNATRTTNELQQSPFFIFLYQEGGDLFIKNEGKGSAYNITIDSIELGDKTFEFGFLNNWYYCGSDEKIKIPFSILKFDGSRQFYNEMSEFLYMVFEQKKDKTAEFIIRFNSPLKNDNYQKIIIKVPEDPVNIEKIKIYNFIESDL